MKLWAYIIISSVLKTHKVTLACIITKYSDKHISKHNTRFTGHLQRKDQSEGCFTILKIKFIVTSTCNTGYIICTHFLLNVMFGLNCYYSF